MNKLFKHTKKFVLVAMTLVMMLATSMVVLGANGENELKTLKPAKTSVTLYVNASEAGKADATTTGKVGAEMVPMDSSVDVDVTAVAKVVGATGDFKVESSNPSVASVVKKDSDTITITAVGNGKATIKLTDADPMNPKKAKTAKVTVTVKTLVDEISFNTDVVKGTEAEQYVKVGVKGKVALGTYTNKIASSQKVKYVLLGDAKKYISVSGKGEVSGKKNTSELEAGYVEVLVLAQDQKYINPLFNKDGTPSIDNKTGNQKYSKPATWGMNKVIKVYVGDPVVKSAKILNVPFTTDKKGVSTETLYTDKYSKAQSYATIELEANVSSTKHTFMLQTEAYSDVKWGGDVVADAVTYTSNKPAIATVDENGVITAVGNGKAVITVVPVDGVALGGKEKLTINVNVTTAAEKIEMASTEVTAFAGSSYTIKANVNKGVKNTKLSYTLKSSTVEAVTLKGNKVTLKEEGVVVVTVASQADSTVKKDITINFINPINKITATTKAVAVKKGVASVNEAAKAVNLFVGTDVNDTCIIDTTTEFKVKDQDGNVVKTTELPKDAEGKYKVTVASNKPAVASVEIVDGKIVVTAHSKGSANITVTATDGSKKKSNAVKINVLQKVDNIAVTNAVNEDVYFVLGAYDATKDVAVKTTAKFAATPTSTANNKKVTYAFAQVNGVVNATGSAITVSKDGKSVTLNDKATAELQKRFESSEVSEIKIGTLTVSAQDTEKFYSANAEGGVAEYTAKAVTVDVYALPAKEYMNLEDLEAAVADAVTAVNGVTVDETVTITEKKETIEVSKVGNITVTKGEKVYLGANIVIPARVSNRTLTYKSDNKAVTVDKNGVITGKSVTATLPAVAKATVTVSGKTENGEAFTTAIQVRVIPSQDDFDKELDAQITALLKGNDYTWLGAKPSFNAKKSTLTLAISDIEMGKDAANAEMKEKLTDAMTVVKDAAELAVYGTATKYNTVTVSDPDPASGNKWALVRVGADVKVVVNGVEVGKYNFTEADEAIADLAGYITTDIDDIVEWANKNLNVTLTAVNNFDGYDSESYETKYTVAVTIKEADVESFLDMKMKAAVDEFKEANDKNATGIKSVTYNPDKNAAVVNIYDGKVLISDAYALVKEQTVAWLEDIFTNATSATVEIIGVSETENPTFDYDRYANSDVNNLVDKLYRELTEKATTIKDLVGIKVHATVDFYFSGTTYTKVYEVSVKRPVDAIDVEVDDAIEAYLTGIAENAFGTVKYTRDNNRAIVTVKNMKATLMNAAGVINDVEGFVNVLTGDTFAKDAFINEAEFKNLDYDTGKISAREVLEAIKPDWFGEKAEIDVLDRTLSELVGTTATVKVSYDEGKVLYYAIEFVANTSMIEAELNTGIEAIVVNVNEAAIADGYAYSLEYITNAELNPKTKQVNVTLNGALDSEENVLAFCEDSLSTLVENVLLEAKKTDAVSATVSLVENDKLVAKSEEISLAELKKETVVAALDSVLKDDTTFGQLDGKQIAINLEYSLGEGEIIVPAFVQYTIDFAVEVPQGATAENPIFMMEQYVAPKLAPGMEVYYSGRLFEMEVTSYNEGSYIIYNGDKYEYNEEEYCVKATIAKQTSMRDPYPVVGIGNAGEEDVELWVQFSYPMGHMNNPEYIEGYATASLEEGDEDGYFYTYAPAGDGTLNLWFASKTEGVDADISVTNMVTYEMYTLAEDGKEDENGILVLTIEGATGDEYMINVASIPEYDENWNRTIKALEYTLGMEYVYPEGSVNNPIFVVLEGDVPTGTVTVPAGEKVYYQSRGIGETYITIENANDAVVYVPGRMFEEEYRPVDGTISGALPAVWGNEPVVFAIENKGTTDATYTLQFVVPVGTRSNPEKITIGSYTSTSEVYYYQFTATTDGAITVDVDDAVVGGWNFVVNGEKADGSYYYGDSYGTDSETDNATIDVKVGDVYTIEIALTDIYVYNDDWTLKEVIDAATEVSFNVSFSETVVEETIVEEDIVAAEEIIDEAIVEEAIEEVIEEIAE